MTNDGPGEATDVVLTDPLPAGLAWTHDQPATCSVAAGELRCVIAWLAEGESFAVRVSAPTTGLTIASVSATVLATGTTTPQPQSCQDLSNTATVSSANEDTTRLDDNTASDTIRVCTPKPPRKHYRHVGRRKVHYDGDGCRLEEVASHEKKPSYDQKPRHEQEARHGKLRLSKAQGFHQGALRRPVHRPDLPGRAFVPPDSSPTKFP